MKTFIVLSAIVVAVFGSLVDINWKNVKQADFLLKGVNSGAPVPNLSIEGRIFGGNVAEPHQFPYQVLLKMVEYRTFSIMQIMCASDLLRNGSVWLNKSFSQDNCIIENAHTETYEAIKTCGGSLISRDFVLTAAHCVLGVPEARVFLGVQNISNPEESHPMIAVSRENIFVHPLYDPKMLTNDVALIRLPAPVVLNDFIQTINLPRPTTLQAQLEGHMVLITGWGKTGDSGNPLNELRYANLRILPESTCAVTFPHQFHTSQLCVSGNVQSVCSGDSGSPLVAQEPDGTNVVVGIASFIRDEGCEKGFPTVFTRVTSFLDWISQTTGIEIRN